MSKELVYVLPTEVKVLADKVKDSKKEEVSTVLNQIFVGTDEWEREIDAIDVKGVDDKKSMELAEVARKNAKDARVSAEKIFDAKRASVQQEKAEFDNEDKLWLKAKQVMQIKLKTIEEKAKWKADFAKRYEADQKEIATQKRIVEVSKYADINRIQFENMNDELFDIFLNGLKSNHEAKIEAERIAEEDRIAKEKADEAERERIRLENIQLKKEADEREELSRIERKKLADAQAELKAKQEAELKIEEERLKAEKETEKLAKAPIKKQLSVWVDSFSIDFPNNELLNNETALEIKSKFFSFKTWAQRQVDNS